MMIPRMLSVIKLLYTVKIIYFSVWAIENKIPAINCDQSLALALLDPFILTLSSIPKVILSPFYIFGSEASIDNLAKYTLWMGLTEIKGYKILIWAVPYILMNMIDF